MNKICNEHVHCIVDVAVHTKHERKNTFEGKKNTPLHKNIPALNNFVEALHIT